MNFIKKHIIMLSAGGVALAAIVVCVLGMMNDSVKVEMQKKINGAGMIGSLRSDPKNEKIIEAEAAHGKELQTQVTKVDEEIKRINLRKPLVNGVFPKPDSSAAAFRFKQEYDAALNGLLREMSAGDLPNAAELEDERENVRELQEFEAMNAQEAAEGAGGGAAGHPGMPPPPPGNVRLGGGGGGTPPPPTVNAAAAGAGINIGDPKYNADFRANIAKAKSIRVYANRAALHVSPILDVPAAPDVQSMWFAQVSLWLQQDFAKAIKELNDAAAAKSQGGDGNIDTSPVKRIERIRAYGYVGSDGKIIEFPTAAAGGVGSPGAAAGGGAVGQSLQVIDMRPSFVNRKPDEDFDVVRLSAILVVDQRDLNAVIDQICKQNFYVCTWVDYGPAEAREGYLYGPDPVVRVTLDFECYLSRKAGANDKDKGYVDMMPAEVRTLLGIAPPGGNP